MKTGSMAYVMEHGLCCLFFVWRDRMRCGKRLWGGKIDWSEVLTVHILCHRKSGIDSVREFKSQQKRDRRTDWRGVRHGDAWKNFVKSKQIY